MDGWKVAVVNRHWLDIPINVGDILTTEELVQKISKAPISEDDKQCLKTFKQVEQWNKLTEKRDKLLQGVSRMGVSQILQK